VSAEKLDHGFGGFGAFTIDSLAVALKHRLGVKCQWNPLFALAAFWSNALPCVLDHDKNKMY
jgi:hypothetical protein